MEKPGGLTGPQAGQTVDVFGATILFKAIGSDTDGSYTLIELGLKPDAGPPPHIHRREDEDFYVLEGAVSITVGGKTSVAEEGAFVRCPKGVAHHFRTFPDRPARLLVIAHPSGIEHFLWDLSQLPAEATLDQVMEVYQEHGVDVVAFPQK